MLGGSLRAATAIRALRPGLHLYELGDRGVLLDEPADRVHVLDPSATLIWRHLAEGLGPTATAVRLAQRFALAGSVAAAHVDAVVTDWRRLGLFDSVGAPADAPQGFAPLGRLRSAAPAVASRRYRLLDSCFRLDFASADLLQLVDPALAHLAAAGDATAPEIALLLTPQSAGFALSRDAAVIANCDGLDGVLPMLEAALGELTLAAADPAAAVNAVLLRRAGNGLLLAGGSEAGKSTLAAGLLGAGFAVLGDGAALLGEPGRDTRCLPFGSWLGIGSWLHLAPALPGLGQLPVHRRADGQPARQLPPPDRRAGEAGLGVRWLVFPHYGPGVDTALTEIPPAVALRRLLQCRRAARSPLKAERFAPLVEWIRSVRCATLVHGELAPAVAAIAGFCRRGWI